MPLALPQGGVQFAQDEEWCIVRVDGEWREIRFHDYNQMYEVEGLYERVFYDVLKCASPATIRRLLESQLAEASVSPRELRVLDLGAGNGIMGEELQRLGVEAVVGVDIIPEAAEAAERDRPDVYADYHVLDMTDMLESERAALAAHDFNCLTCVAALGFGDIPPGAFSEAYNLVADGGWVAFNIKEDFLEGTDRSGFSCLIERILDDDTFELRREERYRHRVASNGDPLHYIAMVGTKREDIADDIVP